MKLHAAVPAAIEPRARGRSLARVSWSVLLFSALLLIASAAQLAYRFTLPTDGWAVMAGSFGSEDGTRLIYQANLVGGPTPLRRGDRVHAVEGFPLNPVLFNLATGERLARARWEAGLPLRYHLLRSPETGRAPAPGDARMRIEVPPKRWTLAAWLRYMVLNVDRAANTVAAIVLMAIAAVVFARAHHTPAARALLLLCAAWMAQWLSGSLPDGVSMTLYPSVRYLGLAFTYSIYGVLITPTLLVFALVFPRPKAWVGRRPWVLALPYAAGGLVWWLSVQAERAEYTWLGTLPLTALAIAALVHSVRTARDPVSRAQLRWVGTGFILGLSLALLTYLPIFGLVGPPWERYLRAGTSLGALVIGVSLAVAVLRLRLFDIDLIIRRTLVYSVVTALLAVVYLGFVVVLQEFFVQITGQTSQVAVVLSTLAIAALFNPLRRGVQAWIDRRFYRPAYNAEQIVASFAYMARDEADLGRLTTELVQVMRATMQPTFVGLWLAKGRERARTE